MISRISRRMFSSILVWRLGVAIMAYLKGFVMVDMECDLVYNTGRIELPLSRLHDRFLDPGDRIQTEDGESPRSCELTIEDGG